MQFVTIRLGDAMPKEKLDQWRKERACWLNAHPEPWIEDIRAKYHQRFTVALEGWLDRGHGSCIFGNPGAREILEDVLMFHQGTRVEHYCWVIMPNHVHLLFTPKTSLSELMRNWKGIAARKIGRGSIWQANYRDTLIRDAEHFGNAVRYIRRNPSRLQKGSYRLWQSERAMGVPSRKR